MARIGSRTGGEQVLQFEVDTMAGCNRMESFQVLQIPRGRMRMCGRKRNKPASASDGLTLLDHVISDDHNPISSISTAANEL